MASQILSTGFQNLPSDVLPGIFQDLSQNDLLTLRLVDKWSKTAVDLLSKNRWIELKILPPQDPVDMPSLIGRLEQNLTAAPYLILLKKLANEFVFWGVDPGNFTLRKADFIAMEMQAQIAYDEALLAIWPKINMGLGGRAPVLNTPDLIRAWLNDPSNSLLLNGILHLSFSELRLRMLPPEIGKLIGLKALLLDNNQLSALPVSMRNLKHLKELSLRSNQFSALPDVIRDMKQLRALYLDYNCMTTLPSWIGDLILLERLSLGDNQLMALPDTIGNLNMMAELTVTNNKLNELPAWIADMNQLRLFWANGNPLIFIPNEVLHLEAAKLESKKFRSELNHHSQGFLAKLYQSIMQRKEKGEIEELFSSLSQSDKNLIFQMIWACAGCPKTEDLQWGEHHAFEDMDRFAHAVRRAIYTKFKLHSPEEQEQINKRLFKLSGAPKKGYAEWVEKHAFENYPRLADAMESPEREENKE